jgi:hypothetical protein
MPVTPSQLNFDYQNGGSNVPPTRIVNYSHSGIDTVVTDKPSWITVVNVSNTSAYVKLHTSVSNLPVGTHTGQIDFASVHWDDYFNPDGSQATYNAPLGTVNVTVVVTQVLVLSVSPQSIVFNYELGAASPAAQTIYVTSENSWTISTATNWLSLSQTTGTNDGSFQISVIPSGLNAGTHTAVVTVNDGVSSEDIAVSLVISEAATGSNYLYVSPNTLNFGFTQLGILPPSQQVEINVSGDWVVSADQSWISLNTSSGTSGIHFIQIGLADTAALSIGEHTAIITIQSGSIVKTVTVFLSVYEFIQDLLIPGELYFTEENNQIVVSSGRIDTHLTINVNSIYEGENYDFDYHVPFHLGTAAQRLGLEARKMIGQRPFSGIGGALVYVPYNPVQINLQIKEVELFADVTVQEIGLNNLLFIKGTIPVNNWMSDLPQKVYVTSKAVLFFSFKANNIDPANLLTVSGAINTTYTFTNGINPFYSVIFSLSELGLKVGDTLRLETLNAVFDVEIKPDGPDHSMIFWENQWGFWDSFECTGEFIVNSDYKDTSYSFRKNYRQMETKVLDVAEKQSCKLNTGWVYSDAEAHALRKMLKSKNIILLYKNEFIKVKSTTKKLQVSKTDQYLKDYSLTFENVIV